MERMTIDFGIDLGTTNSAIAVMKDVGTEIIKNNDDADITPSAVSIDRSGEVRVGVRAKNRSAQSPNDAYREFKRRMGTDFVYKFKQSGAERKPEELSAEVLKELKSNVQQRTGEVIDAAVITVPAAFELPQCDATRRAAQLAGLVESPLLQEPVAAALAYGFQVNAQKAYWLVYDFGGGTFDAALVKSEDGTIRVVNHGGDNFLGGADIDLAIVNEILVPKLVAENDLEDFTYTNKKWAVPFAMLRRAAEVAKIDLSRPGRTETTLEDFEFEDSSGNTVIVNQKLTLDELKRVAAPFILRSTEICKRVLREKNLGAASVERVILVGGPTLAPYYREALKEQLGMTIDHSVDPLTVVARGAAIFAGTQRRATRSSQKASSKAVTIELKYNPVGVDPNPLVGGKIVPPADMPLTGFTVELVNQKTKWRSGKAAVNQNGIFTTTLRAESGQRNTYLIELLDSTGTKWPTSPEILTYTIGAAVSEQVTTHGMGIALADNKFSLVFEKGCGLPAKSPRKTYVTENTLKRGQVGELLRIPICEGESPRADRNKLVGFLKIVGADISRDLPRGSEIEVVLKMNESRAVTVEAYIPVLDQDFKATLEPGKRVRDGEELKAQVDEEFSRIASLKDKAAGQGGDAAAAEDLEAIASASLAKEVLSLSANADDPDSASKCENRLLELRLRVDKIEEQLQWPAHVVEVEELANNLTESVNARGTPQQKTLASTLIADLRQALQSRNADQLRQRKEAAWDLYMKMMFQDPGFWVYMFQEIDKKADQFKDPERGQRLLNQGRAFISHGNVDGLKNVVSELHKMLPEDKVQELQQGYQSGIRVSR